MSDLNQLLQQGLSCYQRGRLEEAKQFCDLVIKIDPIISMHAVVGAFAKKIKKP